MAGRSTSLCASCPPRPLSPRARSRSGRPMRRGGHPPGACANRRLRPIFSRGLKLCCVLSGHCRPYGRHRTAQASAQRRSHHSEVHPQEQQRARCSLVVTTWHTTEHTRPLYGAYVAWTMRAYLSYRFAGRKNGAAFRSTWMRLQPVSTYLQRYKSVVLSTRGLFKLYGTQVRSKVVVYLGEATVGRCSRKQGKEYSNRCDE